MNESQYNLFLSAGAWICAVGAALNLTKLKRRGNVAFVLSCAFLDFGGMLLLIKIHAADALVAGAGGLLIALLVLDVLLRARQQEPRK